MPSKLKQRSKQRPKRSTRDFCFVRSIVLFWVLPSREYADGQSRHQSRAQITANKSRRQNMSVCCRHPAACSHTGPWDSTGQRSWNPSALAEMQHIVDAQLAYSCVAMKLPGRARAPRRDRKTKPCQHCWAASFARILSSQTQVPRVSTAPLAEDTKNAPSQH